MLVVTRRLVAAVAVVVALLLPQGQVSGADVSSELLTDGIRVRSELGFDANAATVRSLIANGIKSPMGLPLTAEEQREMQRRGELRERLQATLDFIAGNGDDFAGGYFDQSVGDLLLVVRTAPSASTAAIAGLKATLPKDAVVHFEPADYSRRDLETVRAALSPLKSVTYLAVDPRVNRVVVAVEPGSESDVIAEAGQLAGAVSLTADPGVVASACTSRLVC